MATNSDPTPKHGGGGGGDLDERMTAVEGRLGVIEKTMVTAEVFQRELGAVRGEIGALRDELHTEVGTVRNDIMGLRGELQAEIAGLGGELRAEIVGLRGELRAGIVDLRGEMRAEIAKIPFELVKWLIALAGIAAAIATTIYNIWFR
jgi:hypothetical protein